MSESELIDPSYYLKERYIPDKKQSLHFGNNMRARRFEHGTIRIYPHRRDAFLLHASENLCIFNFCNHHFKFKGKRILEYGESWLSGDYLYLLNPDIQGFLLKQIL